MPMLLQATAPGAIAWQQALPEAPEQSDFPLTRMPGLPVGWSTRLQCLQEPLREFSPTCRSPGGSLGLEFRLRALDRGVVGNCFSAETNRLRPFTSIDITVNTYFYPQEAGHGARCCSCRAKYSGCCSFQRHRWGSCHVGSEDKRDAPVNASRRPPSDPDEGREGKATK
ncbi:hypothetical protein EYF80_020492 [Liparis tanakae]|uniref:Uncharacterized protein n=1 Tax=Liparis tanakae TaxID=230148 RepID=A0A4Z2HUU8_9TELE|nr:hypothetical protein EYF80_020492 [Liparis tanakae]